MQPHTARTLYHRIDSPNDEDKGQEDDGEKRVAIDLFRYQRAIATFKNVVNFGLSGMGPEGVEGCQSGE
jgi:hypothetical protein